MEDSKAMHDAKWVGAMLYGQHTQFADQGQGQVSGSAEKSVVSGSSMPVFIPNIGDVSQTCPLEHRPTNAATRGLAPA